MDSRYPYLILLACLLAGGCRREIEFKVISGAMEPTIKSGERVMVDTTAYATLGPTRWDVIAFESQRWTNALEVRRVIGLPGETISLTSTGIVVDGALLSMPTGLSEIVYRGPEQLPQPMRRQLISFPYVAPSAHYFLVGDNCMNSYDSRFSGAVASTNIRGKVILN
jgi:signal peptidase I